MTTNPVFDACTVNGPITGQVTATGGTTARTLADRAADKPNVKDFGAVMNGTTYDTAAFNAARAASTLNGTIYVPPGGWQLASTPTGGPAGPVMWSLSGNCYGTGTYPVYQVGGDVVETVLSGGKFISRGSNSKSGASPVLRVDTVNDSASIGAGYVSQGILVNTNASAGNTAYNWGVSSVLTTSSTGGSSVNQDVAVAAVVRQNGASPTWQYFGNTVDTSGRTAATGNGIIGTEQDITCSGPEPTATGYAVKWGGRVGYHFTVSPWAPPVWTANTAVSSTAPYAAVQPTAANGYVYVCTTGGTTGSSQPTWPTTIGNTVADGTAVWTCSTTIATQLARIFELNTDPSASVGSVFNVVATIYNAGLDFSGSTFTSAYSSAPAAIRLAATQVIDFTGDGTLGGQNQHTLSYASGSLIYKVAGATVVSITDAGHVGIGGAAGAAGVALSIGGTESVGIALNASSATTAIRLAAGQVISLEATDTRTLFYDTGSGKLFYAVSGVNKFSIDASGNVRAAGTITGSVTP